MARKHTQASCAACQYLTGVGAGQVAVIRATRLPLTMRIIRYKTVTYLVSPHECTQTATEQGRAPLLSGGGGGSKQNVQSEVDSLRRPSACFILGSCMGQGKIPTL